MIAKIDTTATATTSSSRHPGTWSLSTPVVHTTRVSLRFAIDANQALHAWTRIITAHALTGCSSYELLPDGRGIVVWALPCLGLADPEATYLGTILLGPQTAGDGFPVGQESEIIGLLVAPPYSVADLLVHVQALFGVHVDAAMKQPTLLRQ